MQNVLEKILKFEEKIKKLEDENSILHQTVGFWNSIFLNTTDFLLIIDTQHIIQEFNTFASENSMIFLGQKLKKGVPILNYIPDKTLFKQNYGKFKICKEVKLDLPIQKMHQTSKWLQITNTPIKGGNSENYSILLTIKDISSVKNTELRLLKSKSNLKAMFDSSLYIYNLIGPNYIIYTCNRKSIEHFKNYSGQDIDKQKNILDYIMPEDTNNFIDCFQKCLSGEFVKQENLYIYKNGKKVWIKENFIPVISNSNKIDSVAYTGIDITDSKKANENIRISEEKFSKAFHNNPVYMLINTLTDGRIVDVNQSFLNAISAKKNSITGLTLAELNVFKNVEIFKDINNEIIKYGKIKDVEIQFISSNNEIITCFSSFEKIIIQEEACTLTVMINITARKRADEKISNQYVEIQQSKNQLSRKNTELRKLNENLNSTYSALKISTEELSESENKFRKLAEMLPEIIFETNVEGIITFANQKAYEQIGYSKENIENGLNSLILFTKRDRAKILINIKNVNLNNEIKDNEYSVVRKDGSKFNVLVNVSPIIKDKLIIGYRGIVIDITKQKQVEQTLKKSELELHELNNAKDKFFSIIAHDLKNPFGTVRSFLELILNKFDIYDKAKLKELLKTIYIASNTTYNLLENLLYWSRSHTGRIEWMPEKINLKSIVIENLELLQNNAISKKIKLETQIKDNIFVYADSKMLSTILRNLLSNAVKFSHKDSTVIVDAEYLKEESTETIQVNIIDTGAGISSEKQKRLFKIGEKNISSRGTNDEEGTGVGLILCKEFVNTNKGKIWVESKLGYGSCFKFTIPIFNTQQI